MEERPGWIELLFKRGHGLNAFKTRFLQDSQRAIIEEAVSGDPGDRAQLRVAALAALGSHDRRTIIQALAFLMVVGDPSDLPRIEQFVHDRRETVGKAAKTCRFELQQRARTHGQQ